MQHQEFYVAYHKHQIFSQYWIPNESKAIVLLVHGMGEHSARYTDYVIPELLAKHIAVITYDNFGHGKSSGKRGHCPDYSSLMELIGMMISKTESLLPNTPIFLYGHSMGGNLVINYVLKQDPKVNGVILSSPFFRLAFQPPTWKMSMGKLLQHIAPSITLPSGLDTKAISRIPEKVEKYEQDPLVHDKISPNFSFPIMEAGKWAMDHGNLLQKPTLVFHGTDDRLIDYTATQEFSEKSDLADLVLFEEGYHELHNDLEKEKLLATILKWIDKQL
ncbi:alpha/beta hydrolase [Aquimarina spongiae]|uniref:Lysophospholipase, alpha-beta hydrolase superfamily n=1 Tax=Aquimarina spongiae TaxID=570521 RepID=A0A1M6AE80_9FLAO|nr:alpha/beta hydrolase [Aquimarina spongiae]SHI34503.1 Lysophospholipase, alpha-beta hydrolase superfamily [Aquimarina spongiae]